MKEIGIRTYDLNADQIMDIVENVGPEGELTALHIDNLKVAPPRRLIHHVYCY